MLQKVVVGILRSQHKVLVALRPEDKPYGGYWEFPGGKIEASESGAEALKRELHEELGIDVVATQFAFDHTHDYPDKTVYLEIWLVTEFVGDPQGMENQELRWVTWDEMLDLQLLQGNRLILDKVKELVSQ